MFKVLLLILMAGQATPQPYFKGDLSFATLEECKAALPALDARVEEILKPRKRGEDYEFEHRCVSKDDGSI